jgi:hypothetical protein
VPWLVGWTGAVTDGTYDELPAGGGTRLLDAGRRARGGRDPGRRPPSWLHQPGPVLAQRQHGDPEHPARRPRRPADPGRAQTGYDGVDTTQLSTLGEDSTPLASAPGNGDATGLGAPTASIVTALAQR